MCECASGKITISDWTATDPPGTHPAKDHHDFTKPEREYVKGIVHNLSYQRLTDQEIVQWLHDEKQIDLDRSTVTKIKNQINIV
jgi:DNA-directed RNA polymerase specialized sigma54-like protein